MNLFHRSVELWGLLFDDTVCRVCHCQFSVLTLQMYVELIWGQKVLFDVTRLVKKLVVSAVVVVVVFVRVVVDCTTCQV